LVAILALALCIAGYGASPVSADDATVRMRIAANDVHVAAYDNTLRHAITSLDSLARRTALTVLAFRRLTNHTRVVENTALNAVYVVQVFLGKLEHPDVALDSTDAPTAQGVSLLRSGLAIEQRGLRDLAASYGDLAGELDRVILGDHPGAKRALKRADHALASARPILARAARFGAKAQGLLGVPLDDIFL
jgi:hypothetical protein